MPVLKRLFFAFRAKFILRISADTLPAGVVGALFMSQVDNLEA
jgi:hypothetical protein